MPEQSSRPFQGRKMTRAERKAADKRSAARAAARAAALPPPDPASRVQIGASTATAPADGRRSILTPSSARPAAESSGSQSPRRPSPFTRPAPAAGEPKSTPEPRALPNPAPARPKRSLNTPAAALTVTGAEAVSSAEGVSAPEPRASVLSVVRSRWSGRYAPAGVIGGGALVITATGYTLIKGAPVLQHGTRLYPLLAGLAALIIGVGAISRGWHATGRRARTASAAVTIMLTAALTVGALSNPVIINNRVFLSTSKQAHEYQLMNQIHTDLLRMRDQDTALLNIADTDAAAHVNDYQPAFTALQLLVQKYSAYTTSNLPDPRFMDAVTAVKAAAYYEGKAMNSKYDWLQQNDVASADDVSNYRNTFAQQYLAAGRDLSFLSADLNIPFDQREHE